MKKLFFLAIAILSFGQIAEAQIIFGGKASIGATVARDETTSAGQVFDHINHDVIYKGSNIVKSIGIFGQQKFGYLFGRAELSYTNYTQEFDVRSFVQLGQGTERVYEKFDFIDFQLLAGVTHNNVRLGVGPVAHFLVGYEPGLDFISGYRDQHRVLSTGLTGAIGLDAGRFHLDLRYEHNFRTVGDHIYYGDRDAGFTNKPHIINFTLGVSI